MKIQIVEGTTSKLIRVFIQDSTSTTGGGLTGLVYNSTNLTSYYIQEGDPTPTSITLADMTVGTWISGGFKEVDSTNMPGIYEIGLPDAVVDATSEGTVLLYLFEITTTALNIVPVVLEIQLDEPSSSSGSIIGTGFLGKCIAGNDYEQGGATTAFPPLGGIYTR